MEKGADEWYEKQIEADRGLQKGRGKVDGRLVRVRLGVEDVEESKEDDGGILKMRVRVYKRLA